MSWFIVNTNYIFWLHAYPFSHSKDDDECSNNLITNGWIFSMPSLYALLNSSFTFVLPNNSASSSCLHMCSLLCASFSLVILYNFSMAVSALILVWTPKLWNAHNFQQTQITFDGYPIFFHPWTSCSSHSFFYSPNVF